MTAVALCALILLALISLPASAQSISFAGLQTTVPASGLNAPYSVGVDGAGDVFIADTGNNRIVEVPATCNSTSCQIVLPASGLNSPEGVAADGLGNVFIADTHNNRVLEIPAGCTTSSCQQIVGGGFSNPAGLGLDEAGDLFIADFNNNRVVELPVGCTSTSCQTTSPASGLNGPAGVAVDTAGDLFIADYYNNRIVKLPAGCATSSCEVALGSGLSAPAGVAVDRTGNVYVVDTGNNRVVDIPSGCTSSSCQTTVTTGLNGPLGLAVAVNAAGDVFVADTYNSRVLEVQRYAVNFGSIKIGSNTTITLTYNVNTSTTLSANAVALTQGASNMDFVSASGSTCVGSQIAGSTCTVTVTFGPLAPGLRNGAIQILSSTGAVLATTAVTGQGIAPAIAYLPGPAQIQVGSGFYGTFAVVDASGNIYVADTYNYNVIEIPSGCASATCQLSVGSGLNSPYAVAVDGLDNVYIADTGNNRVIEVPVGCTTSSCIVVVATGLNSPEGVAVDGYGNIFIGDTHNNRIVEVPAGCSSSSCWTIMGVGLNEPAGLAVDGWGNLYVADYNNNRVVEIRAGCFSAACQTTLVSGLSGPGGVAIDAAGDLFVADFNNSQVLEIPAGCTSTSCQTSIGTGLKNPAGVAVDSFGDVFIADSGNSRVLEEQRSQIPSLMFPATALKGTSSAQTVTLQNIGNAPLTFSGISVGTNFTLSAGSTTCSTSSSLAPGASCNVAVVCTPTASGNLSGTLTLTDNALNGAPANQQIPLTCNGQGLNVTPSNLNFGTVELYSWNEQTVTVTNATTSAININSVSLQPGSANYWEYPFVNFCWGSLAPGKSCQIWVFFFANQVGTEIATLNINNSTGGGSTQPVSLTANVVHPVAQFNPWDLNFWNQAVGSKTTWPVQLKNVGQTNLNISSIGIGGWNPGDFSQSNNCPASLAPGANCTINVTFDPTQRNYRQAALIVYDNVWGGQSVVGLQGFGH